MNSYLTKQNSELREAHHKSLNEMEETKKFQSSTFDTIARRRLVEDTILELTGKIQDLLNEINCTNDSKDFQDAESFAVEIPTLPVNQCHSHLIQFLAECYAVLWECRAAKWYLITISSGNYAVDQGSGVG